MAIQKALSMSEWNSGRTRRNYGSNIQDTKLVSRVPHHPQGQRARHTQTTCGNMEESSMNGMKALQLG